MRRRATGKWISCSTTDTSGSGMRPCARLTPSAARSLREQQPTPRGASFLRGLFRRVPFGGLLVQLLLTRGCRRTGTEELIEPNWLGQDGLAGHRWFRRRWKRNGSRGRRPIVGRGLAKDRQGRRTRLDHFRRSGRCRAQPTDARTGRRSTCRRPGRQHRAHRQGHSLSGARPRRHDDAQSAHLSSSLGAASGSNRRGYRKWA